MYDQYGKSRTTKKSDTAPSRPSTFDQFKRRETNRGLGSKPRTFGGGQDNNPNRDEAESRSVVAKVYERAVTRFRNFGASEPDDVIVDGKRVYQGPLFRGFQPTMPTENFGGEYGKRNYLFGIEKLGIQTYPTPPSPTLPSGVDNPRLNMFGVNRRFTRTPASPELPTSPDTPANVDAITRGISQALIPTEVDYTIKVGDTLSEIAEDRGTTVEVLMRMNNIKEEDKDTIYAGDKLKVPPKKAKTYKDVDDNLFVSSGQIMSDAFDPDSEYYKSFRQGITPNVLMIDSYSFMKDGSKYTDALKRREADNYDTIFGNAEKRRGPFKGTKISDMTMNEVFEFVKAGGKFNEYNKKRYGENTTAVGKYQTVGATLRDLDKRGILKELGITGNTKFDATTQDRIAAHLAINRLLNRASFSKESAREEMRKEWAGFKKLSDKELDEIIKEIGDEIGKTFYDAKDLQYDDPNPGKSLRPKVKPKGLGAK